MATLKVRASHSGGWVQGAAVSTWHFSGTGPADAQDAADKVRAFYFQILALLPNYGVTTVEPDVVELDTATGLQVNVYSTSTSPVTGSNTTDQLPTQTQGLLRLATGTVVGGHSLKGKIFIPGPCESDNAVGGVPSATYKSTINTAAASTVLTGSPSLVVYSPTYHANGAVTAATCWNKWAYLSSRRD